MAIKLKNCLFAGAILYAAVFALYGNNLVDAQDPYWGSEMGTHGRAYSGTQSGGVPYTAIGKFTDVSSGFRLTEEATGGGRLGGGGGGNL